MKEATTIQERLKDLRVERRLKLEDVAAATGISKSALGNYENDDYKEINHGNLILLAKFYDVSVVDFLVIIVFVVAKCRFGDAGCRCDIFQL